MKIATPPSLKQSPSMANSFPQIIDFLGGSAVFRHSVSSRLEAHELISEGFPGSVLGFMLTNIAIFRDPELLQKAMGVSLRTTQRKTAPQKALTQTQSGRAWKFAEIMTQAVVVFGTQLQAETWLVAPALALEQHRPIDLLSTPAGVELVQDLLTRLEYGVYA